MVSFGQYMRGILLNIILLEPCDRYAYHISLFQFQEFSLKFDLYLQTKLHDMSNYIMALKMIVLQILLLHLIRDAIVVMVLLILV